MAQAVKILVATMTGTAELVAEEVEELLADKGFEASISLMDGLDDTALQDPDQVYLICSSTYGQGDVPDNGQALIQSLTKKKPDLSHVAYGVVALGDKTYVQTYCNGGLTFDREMTALGARRIGEIFQHDASSGTLAEEEVLDWAEDWANALHDALKSAA